MRRALAALLIALAAPATAGGLTGASYADPTTRYPHGALGDTIEHGTLVVTTAAGRRVRLVLPETRVFEDTVPRLADVDNDGDREAVVVESDRARGARLAIYDDTGLIAATPFIGRRFRWLAVVGADDLDGDGQTEIAYIDRPHLARTLRVWRLEAGALVEVASATGLTNHRIGDREISGGIRHCGGRAEMIVTDTDWRRLIAVTLDNGRLTAHDLGPHAGPASLAAAMACAN